MVDDHTVVLAGGEQIGKAWMEVDGRNVVLVTGESLNASLGLVVPYTDCLGVRDERKDYQVITSCDEIGFVSSGIVVQTINTFLMAGETVVATTLSERPNLT